MNNLRIHVHTSICTYLCMLSCTYVWAFFVMFLWPETHWLNPQYKLTLSHTDNDSNNICTVIIQLEQKCIRMARYKLQNFVDMGFVLYKVWPLSLSHGCHARTHSHTHTYTHIYSTYACTHTYTRSLERAHTHMHTRTCTYMRTAVHAQRHACTRTHTHTTFSVVICLN